MKRKFFLIVCLLLCSLLGSCAMIVTRQAQEQMNNICNGLMGLTEEEVIISLGSPQKIEDIGKVRVFHYYRSYGTRLNAYSYALKTWEAYDQSEIVFKDGIAISWKGFVQR